MILLLISLEIFYRLKFFFNKTDQRGVIETEIIHCLVLSEKIPNSWNSLNALTEKFYKENLGETEESVRQYLEKNTTNINRDF